jgi:hypothetical protein
VCDAGWVRFGFEQQWDAGVDEVIEIYLDEAFWSGLDALSRTGTPEVLGVARSGDRAVVRLRYSLDVELPGEAARFIDTGEVTWVEETTWDLPLRRATVRFLPAQGGGLLRASASATMEGARDSAIRRVTGELRVRIPLVGGRVERAIVDGIGEHLDAEAAAVAERLT